MKKIILIILLTILITPSFSYAAEPVGGTGTPPPVGGTGNPPKATTDNKTFAKLQNPLNADSIEDVVFLSVDIAMYLGMAFAILSIIFVGFKFVAAQGNEDKLKEAKSWLLWIVIGLAVLISARVIVDIVRNTLVDSGVVQKNFLKP